MSNDDEEENFRFCSWCHKKKPIANFINNDLKFRKICSSCYNKLMQRKKTRKTHVTILTESHVYSLKCPICGHKHFKVTKARQGNDLELRCYGCNYLDFMDLAKFLQLTKPKKTVMG